MLNYSLSIVIFKYYLEGYKLKKKLLQFLAVFWALLLLTACGRNPELERFRKSVDDFCTKVSEIDTAINGIDASSDNAVKELLSCLDDLDLVFQSFARLDFPEEYDYLEKLAGEAGAYMTEAVSSFHQAYSGNSYNESVAEYAQQNYNKAYKRIQIIITFLHGEEPTDVDLSAEYQESQSAH